MLWFGITSINAEVDALNGRLVVLDQQVHGPYSSMDALEDAINLKIEEATEDEEGGIIIPIRFSLCTEDVPELVE